MSHMADNVRCSKLVSYEPELDSSHLGPQSVNVVINYYTRRKFVFLIQT